jgi:hypothetical protein
MLGLVVIPAIDAPAVTIDMGRYAIDRSGHGNHGIIVGAKYARTAAD